MITIQGNILIRNFMFNKKICIGVCYKEFITENFKVNEDIVAFDFEVKIKLIVYHDDSKISRHLC